MLIRPVDSAAPTTRPSMKETIVPPDRPLLMIVEHFLRRTGVPPTRFGRLAARDPRLVSDLRRGRTPGAVLRSRIEHFVNIYQENADVDKS